ncbi:MAG: hypothetical protein KIH63_000610 [Candidatus Saccharibacteria bacterium]|nr:hypothetical protein [Candidatus Saccharibacteria bacterium]
MPRPEDWEKLVSEGSITAALGDINQYEDLIVRHLVPEERLPMLHNAPFSITPLDSLIYPKGFNGTIGAVTIEYARTNADELPSIGHLPAKIDAVEEVHISAQCMVTGYGDVGTANLDAWYVLASNGSWSDPVSFPLKRKSIAAYWSEGSTYPDIMAEVRHAPGVAGVGKQRNNVARDIRVLY